MLYKIIVLPYNNICQYTYKFHETVEKMKRRKKNSLFSINNLNRNSAIIGINLVLILIVSGCSSYRYNDHLFGPDKVYHFAVAGVIGACTTAVVVRNGASDSDAPVIGVSVAMAIGAGKEFYDLSVKETYWSWKDMLWNLFGGAAGSYIVSK